MTINTGIFIILTMLAGIGLMTILAFAGVLPNLVFG